MPPSAPAAGGGEASAGAPRGLRRRRRPRRWWEGQSGRSCPGDQNFQRALQRLASQAPGVRTHA
eukprot:15456196-Alexandrium_andersonii.AAC.1